MRNASTRHAVIAAAALAVLSPAAALAQDNSVTMDTTATDDTGYETPEREEEDNDFPWGLLGLLGLAGLLGRKKREADIHVDARRNP